MRSGQLNLAEAGSVVSGLNEVEVITLFAEDLAACREFYTTIFGLEVVYEDDESVVVQLRNMMINLLAADSAPMLVEPTAVGSPAAGPRALYTISVEDVRATAAELTAQGVTLLNGPIDRPWGRRTAAFTDPAGNVWEIAQVID
jgi:lactoylglutathione lyase